MLKAIFDTKTILLYITAIVGLFFIVTLLSFMESPKVVYVPQKEKVYIVEYRDKPDKFTKEKLIQYLKDLNIKYPEVVYAQAVMESGNFTSKKFRDDNNLFGMRKAKSRCTVALEGGTYAKFKTWRESVIDYALYQTTFVKKIKSQSEYINHLAENYATGKAYKGHLIKMIEQVEKEF
jgi:uncharacterized FlgJ-related protein